MSGNDFLLDTNAVLYYLSGDPCMEPFRTNSFSISIITEIELLSFPDLSSEEEYKIRSFIDRSLVVGLTEEIKKNVISLRKQYRIKIPDAIIAASSLAGGFTLVTADKGFCSLKQFNLNLITPQRNEI